MAYSLMITSSAQPELRSSAPVRKMAIIGRCMTRQDKNPESLHSTVLDSAVYSQMVAMIIVIAITYWLMTIISDHFDLSTLV
jgi:hypothetical protein